MDIDRRFERAVGRMPQQTRWTSIQENKLKVLRNKADLFDELIKSCRNRFADGSRMASIKALIDLYAKKAEAIK